MAKISLSGLTRTRLKFRILTFVAVLLLFGIFAEMIVVKNPKQSKAAGVKTFNSTTTNTISETDDLSGYDEVFIDNVEVTMYSPIGSAHTIKKLTIKGPNAKLTHEGLNRTPDYDSNKNMQNSGLVKRVDIIADEINMFNGGSIDVSGRGERGGWADKTLDCIAQWGYPSIEWASSPPVGDFYTDATLPSPYNRGGGEGAIANEDAIRIAGAGGGGHGGKGGYGYIGNYNSAQFDLVRGGSKNDSEQEPALWGSGGGGGCSKKGTDVAVDGANGGGRVRIRANIIRFDSSTSGIYTQGSNVNINSSNRDATGGAGAGGSIWLADKDGNNNTNSKLVIEAKNRGAGLNGSPNVDSGYNLDRALVPVAEAGTAYFGGSNSSGLNLYGSYFHANGGDAIRNNGSEGGAGGGGRIAIYGIFQLSCYITQSDPDYIPSYCENRDVVVDGERTSGSVVPVRVDTTENGLVGARSFANLTVKNNAVLTQTQIIDDDTNRMVGLTLAGPLMLESGGKIDVSEKGFLGGIKDGNAGSACGYNYNGLGRGGGTGRQYGTRGGGAGAGSYGGLGGNGTDQNYAGSVNGDALIPNNQFYAGSGGGGIFEDNCDNRGRGGNGGGRVKITAPYVSLSATSYIHANGGNGGDDNRAHGAGGSGGAIVLEVSDLSGGILPEARGGWGGSNVGANGTIRYNGFAGNSDYTPISGTNINLSANGGSGVQDAEDGGSGGGGGGRIYISKTSNGISGISIKKVLEPVDRNGSALFNPYALLKDDKIRVKLNVTNMTQAITLKDEFLSNRDGTSCQYVAGSASPSTGVTTDISSITWTGLTPGSGSSAEAYYVCQVQ